MKRLIASIGLCLCLCLAGCPGAHSQERAENAIAGAGHQAQLELCLQDAQKSVAAGAADEKIKADFAACADAAAKANGGK